MRECFVISRFGQPGTKHRKWSDLIFEAIIEPVASEKGYNASRTLEQKRPGDITWHIAQQIGEADLVIADLTGLNPNVMYELALRHSTGKPFIHLSDDPAKIPFDILQMNTIKIGTDRAMIESAKSELKAQIAAIESAKVDFSTPFFRFLSSQHQVSGKVYIWEMTYSSTLAFEWLDQQSKPFKDVARNFFHGSGRLPTNKSHRKLLAELKAYRDSAGLRAQGDLYYFFRTAGLREEREVAGYGIVKFVGDPTPIPIEITGQEKRNGALEVKFDQPAREVEIASGIKEKVPSFVFTIHFSPDPISRDTFSGLLMHPTANPALKVGDTKLVLRC